MLSSVVWVVVGVVVVLVWVVVEVVVVLVWVVVVVVVVLVFGLVARIASCAFAVALSFFAPGPFAGSLGGRWSGWYRMAGIRWCPRS